MKEEAQNNYYRKITVSLPQRFFETAKVNIKQALKKENLKLQSLRFGVLFLIVLFIFLGIYSILSYFEYVSIKETRMEAESNLTYWEKVSRENPNAPDVYFQAGLYAAELSENQRALDYLNKAIELDPSFKKAIEFEKKILGEK